METAEFEQWKKQFEAMVDHVISKREFEEAFLTVSRLGIGSVPAVERVMELMQHTQFFPERIAREVFTIGTAFWESMKADDHERSVAELFEQMAALLARTWASCLVMGALAGTAALGSSLLSEADALKNGSPTVH